MASVAPTASSTKETTNYARLCRLLVDIGTQALRDTLDAIHAPADLHTFLAANKPTLQSLKGKRIINPTQWGKLFPSIPTSVSSRDFDTTLLIVLLRNLCGLTAPLTGWDALPAATDLSREADIARVKYFRNTVYGHAEIASVDDIKFNDYWRDIRDTLVRLGGVTYEAAIDDLRNETMDPEVEDHYVELLSQWKKDENNIKDQLAEIKKKLEVLTSKDIIDEERAPDGNQSSPKGNLGEGLLGATLRKITELCNLQSGQLRASRSELDRTPGGNQSSPQLNLGESLSGPLLQILTGHGDVQSGQVRASRSERDRTPGGNQSSPQLNLGESLSGPLLQILTGHGDVQSGQLTLKGREIYYRSHGRVHSLENPLVYKATAWDLESGFSCGTSDNDRKDAEQHAVDELMRMLKSAGHLS